MVKPSPIGSIHLMFFLFLHKNICCGYSLEVPQPKYIDVFLIVPWKHTIFDLITAHTPISQPWWLSWMRIRQVIRRLQVRPPPGWQYSFVEIDHEIFSTVILSLPLIQEGQLSVSGKIMCTILVNRLEDYACPVNMWLGKLTALDMTPLGWLGRKTSTRTNILVMMTMFFLMTMVILTHW